MTRAQWARELGLSRSRVTQVERDPEDAYHADVLLALWQRHEPTFKHLGVDLVALLSERRHAA